MGAAASDLRSLSADQVVGSIAEYFHSRNMTLSEAFTLLDGDRNDFISFDEFQHGIHVCLVNAGIDKSLPKEEFWRLFKRFDINNDNKLSLEEFAAHFSPSSIAALHQWWDEEMRYRRGPGTSVYSSPAFGASPATPSFGSMGYTGAGYTGASATSLGYTGASAASLGYTGAAATDLGYAHPRAVVPSVSDIKRVNWVLARIAAAVQRASSDPAVLFDSVDLDKSGKLNRGELERVLVTFQPDLSETEKEMVFKRFDKDGSLEVDVHEFCTTLAAANGSAIIALENKLKILGHKFKMKGLNIHNAFNAFDANMDGYLTQMEWQHALNMMTPGMSPADQESIFQMFDINSDNLMSTHEFHLFFQDTIDRAADGYPTRGLSTESVGTSSWPTAVAYPVEELWEREVLDKVRACLNTSGMTISEVFRRLDSTGTNSMDLMEFASMVTAYRPDLESRHIERLFQIVNYSGSGRISIGEFIRRFG